LLGVDSAWKLYVFVIVYGFFYGGMIPLVPAAIRYYFGTRVLGQLNGLSHSFSMAGGAIGAVLAGYIVDVLGSSYSVAFLTGMGVWLTAAVLAWFVKPVRQTYKKAASQFASGAKI
jgi:MFS family permease